MYEKTIIEFGFGKISWSIRPGVCVTCLSLKPWLMTQTSVLIIYDIMQKLHPLIAYYNCDCCCWLIAYYNCDQNIKFIFWIQEADNNAHPVNTWIVKIVTYKFTVNCSAKINLGSL